MRKFEWYDKLLTVRQDSYPTGARAVVAVEATGKDYGPVSINIDFGPIQLGSEEFVLAHDWGNTTKLRNALATAGIAIPTGRFVTYGRCTQPVMVLLNIPAPKGTPKKKTSSGIDPNPVLLMNRCHAGVCGVRVVAKESTLQIVCASCGRLTATRQLTYRALATDSTLHNACHPGDSFAVFDVAKNLLQLRCFTCESYRGTLELASP